MENEVRSRKPRSGSALSKAIRRAESDETPQLVETTVTSSLKSSTREAELREAAIDAHSRFLRAEAWLDAHDEAHPRWDDAVNRMGAAILAMVSIEQEALDLGIENIFGIFTEKH